MDSFHQALGNLSGSRVLDVATGYGEFIRVLMANLRDYTEIVGVEKSGRRIQSTREYESAGPAHWAQMDAYHLGFADACFDTVSISNVLHHLADVPRALAEMLRVLKPNGHFIVSEMYCDGQTNAQMAHVLMHHWIAAIDSMRGFFHRETYARQQIADLVTGLGLRNVILYDVADLSGDPKDEHALRGTEWSLDLYVKRLQKEANGKELLERGERVRQYLHTFGIHSATTLVAIGEKC